MNSFLPREARVIPLISAGPEKSPHGLWRILIAWLAFTLASPSIGLAAPDIPLQKWREEAALLRQQADNNAFWAYTDATRLLAEIPFDATRPDRAMILNRLARAEVVLGKTAEAAGHAQQALEVAKSFNDSVGLAEAYLNIAIIAIDQADVAGIANAPELALKALRGVDRLDLLTEALLRHAMSLRRFGKLEESIATCVRMSEIAQNARSALAMAYAHQCMAVSYDQSDRKREAREQYELMRTRAEESGSRILEAEAVFGLSMQEFSIGMPESSEARLDEASLLFRSVGSPFALARMLSGRAELMRSRNLHGEAVKLLDEVLHIYREHNNRIGMWQTLMSRGSAYQALGHLDAALADGRNGALLARAINLPLYRARSAERLSEVYAVVKDYQRAYDQAQEARQLNELIAKEKSADDVVRLTERYQNESTQREIDRLTRLDEYHRHMHRLFWTMAAAGLILFVVTVYFLVKQRQSKRRLMALNRDLNRSRNQLRATLDAIPDLLFKMDAQGRYLECHSNYQSESALALPREQLVGKTLAEVLPPDAAAICMTGIQQAAVYGRSLGLQYSLELPDGIRWFELSIARKQTEDAGPPAFIGLTRDITAHKRYQAALLQRTRLQEQVAAVAQAVPGFLFTIRVEVDGRTHFPYASDGIEALFGLRPEDIRTDAEVLRECYDPEDLARVRELMQETARSLEAFRIEIRVQHRRRKDWRWIEIRSTPQRQPDGATEWHGLMIDITERKGMEETIFRERATLQAFFRSLPALAWMKDPDGRILACNPVFEQLYGAAEADIVGKTDADFVGPEEAAFFRQKDKEAMAAGGPIVFEEPVVFASNGRHALVETVKTPVFDAEHKIIGVMGIAHDITERKRAEIALAAREREFRTLVDNLPDLVIRYDRDCRRLFVNHALTAISGKSADQLIGISPADSEVYTPETKACLLQAIRKTFDCGERQEVDIERDGRDFVLLIVPERDSEGKVATALAIARDVTAIRSVERRMARFMANASAFVFTFRRFPDGRCCFPFASPGIETLFAIEPHAVRNDMAPLHSQVHPEDAVRIEEAIVESARSITPFHFEFRVPRQDLNERWIESRAVPEVGADGSVLWQGVMLDITDRKRLEAALRESEARYRYHSNLLQSIFESSKSVSIYALDREYRYLTFNNKCRENAKRKWRTDIAVGMCMLDVVDTEAHREFCRQGFDQVLAGRSFSLESKEPVVADGITVYEYNENYGAPIRNDSGEIVGLTIFAFNITERKQLEATLLESEARHRYNSGLLQSIFDSPYSVSVYALDRDYRFLALNDRFREAARRLWGRDAAVGMSIMDVIDTEEHREFFRQGAEPVLAGRSYMVESKEAVLKDGVKAHEYHENYGSPIRNDSGAIIGLTVFAIDITERKRIQEQLIAREREYRTLVENLPDLITRYDSECRRLVVNSAVCRTFNRSPDELIGKTPADSQIFVPGLGKRLEQTVRRAFDTGAVQQTNFEYSEHEYSLVAVPETGEAGQVETVLCISRDVTAIRAVERSMSRFMGNAAAFVFTFRRMPDGRCSFPFASPGIKALFGIEPDAVRNDMAPLHSQVHPDDATKIEEAMAESARSLTPLHMEFRVLRPRQPERWIESRSVPEAVSDGSIVWQGVMLDITERKLAEESLLAKEKALAEAQRIAHVGSWELDLLDCSLRWSDEAFSIFEVDPARYGSSQKAFYETIHPDDRDQVNMAFARSLANLEPYAIEYRLLMPDGRIKYVFECCETHYDTSGRPLRSVGTVQDITDRKSMELALIRSESEFRTLAENSPDYIARYDTNGQIRYVNSQLAQLGAFSAEKAIKRPIGAYLPTEEIRSAYVAAYTRVLRTGVSEDIETATDTLGERTSYFQIRFVPERNENEEICGVLAIGHDISELKYKERELEESRDLLRKLSAHLDSAREDERKHIAREIHDHLGQLLTAQRLDISTMKYQYGAGNPGLDEYCQHLLNVTDVTIQSVRDMATLLRPSSLDMGVIPALEWLTADFRKRSGIACEVVSDCEDLTINEQLSLAIFRIVQESLTNVMRHAEAQNVHISLTTSDEGLRLEIQDDGKGFDTESVSHRSFGLLGIRERALAIGGNARIISSPGNGTLIEVQIPFDVPESQGARPPA